MRIHLNDKLYTLGDKEFVKLPVAQAAAFISGLCRYNASGNLQCFVVGVSIYGDISTVEYCFGYEVEE